MASAARPDSDPRPPRADETAATEPSSATGKPTADAAAPLPKAIELMWGLDAGGKRGPRRGLSVEQIVDAAIALADEEGLAALSMTRVAERLGFTAMSLYRYVDSKATLLEIALDRLLGPPPEIPPGTPWRAALETWARTEYRVISGHVGWLSVHTSAPPLGPNNLAWLETGLAALAPTRLPEQRKLQLVVNLSLYVLGRARLAADVQPESAESEGDWGAIEHVLDPQRFPALTAAVRAQAFEQQEDDWEELFFGNGLTLLLNGYEQFIASYE